MVWIVAMSSGIITSVILETFILWKQLGAKEAFKTAVGMSMISMLLMEVAMNVVDLEGEERTHAWETEDGFVIDAATMVG